MLPVVNRLGNGIGISFPSEKWFWVQGFGFRVLVAAPPLAWKAASLFEK
jgi:hypothetical protein